MKNKEFEEKLNSIQEKLGKDNSSKIADDIGILITDNATTNKALEDKDKEIAKLKAEKENLISVNGSLLQQVAMGVETDLEPEGKKKEEKKIIDFRLGFDEKGNFKK